jgi:opacity protein-like surface antigen
MVFCSSPSRWSSSSTRPAQAAGAAPTVNKALGGAAAALVRAAAAAAAAAAPASEQAPEQAPEATVPPTEGTGWAGALGKKMGMSDEMVEAMNAV